MAERLSTDLAARGLVIISGLARGVDTASHRGAVAPRERRSRFLAPESTSCTPGKTTRLTEQIIALGGALITEFPVGTSPARRTFLSATGSSAACPLACWSSKPRNTAARASLPALRSNKNRDVYARPGQRNQQELLGTEHVDQAGRETRRHLGDCGKSFPTDVQVSLSAMQI